MTLAIFSFYLNGTPSTHLSFRTNAGFGEGMRYVLFVIQLWIWHRAHLTTADVGWKAPGQRPGNGSSGWLLIRFMLSSPALRVFKCSQQQGNIHSSNRWLLWSLFSQGCFSESLWPAAPLFAFVFLLNVPKYNPLNLKLFPAQVNECNHG